MSAVTDYYTAGARSAGGHFGADRGGGRKHRGQDFSHSTRPGTVGVPALLGGVVVGKLEPASWHGFGYQITTRVTFNGRDYLVSYAHGPWASQQKIGEAISQGQIILHEGNSGATSGSCVHVEVQVVGGGFIDPWPFIQAVLAGGGAAGGLQVDGLLGGQSIRRWQEVLGTGADGVISTPRSAMVAEIQRRLNAAGARDWDGRELVVDGAGIYSNVGGRQGRTRTIYALQRYLGTPADGYLDGPPSGSAAIREVQRRLNAGTF